MGKPKYKRVLLKMSGDALRGEQPYGINPIEVENLARRVKALHGLGVELAMVIGGGNILRGAQASAGGMNRATADYMGMMATMINGLALQDGLERSGVETRMQTAINIQAIAEPYVRRKCLRHLEKGRVVILAGGTGHPYFTTDTTAALRAMEINADVVIKATKVNGVYSEDPVVNPSAERFDRLSYMQVIERGLKVMDTTAITLCMENRLPIIVLDLNVDGNIERAVCGESVGTYVGSEADK